MIDTDDLDEVLAAMMSFRPGVSDLNFTVGRPPQVEVDGKLEPVTFSMRPEPLSAVETEAIALALAGSRPSLMATLSATGSCDTAHTLGDGSRMRVNVFKVRGDYSIVLRALPSEIPAVMDLGLPQVVSDVSKLQNGLVLVTGATGSGKTTTMTAILNEINSKRPVHVVTLEDPIEFVHKHNVATFNQRELGTDFSSFAGGLKAALRQAPKVIFVGEIRDRDTMETALKAAETGHLVLGTLHTIDAGRTITRIADMVDNDEQQLVRSSLSETLRFVISQRLLPRQRGGRVAAVEVMGNDSRVRELIRGGEDEEKTFYKVVGEGRSRGWQTFDQHIVDLYRSELITEETARGQCSDGAEVNREIDKVRADRGEETSEPGNLEMAFTRRLER